MNGSKQEQKKKQKKNTPRSKPTNRRKRTKIPWKNDNNVIKKWKYETKANEDISLAYNYWLLLITRENIKQYIFIESVCFESNLVYPLRLQTVPSSVNLWLYCSLGFPIQLAKQVSVGAFRYSPFVKRLLSIALSLYVLRFFVAAWYFQRTTYKYSSIIYPSSHCVDPPARETSHLYIVYRLAKKNRCDIEKTADR